MLTPSRPRTLLLLALPILGAACGEAQPPDDAEDRAAAVVPVATLPATPVLSYDDDPAFEVRINHDAAAITEDVLPALSARFGLDAISLSTQTLKSGTAGAVISALSACHTSAAQWHIKLKNVEIDAGLASDSFVVRFDSGRKLLGDLDLPTFEADGTLEFSWPRDVGGWWCDNFGSDYKVAVNVNVDGVDGSLDVTLASSGSIAISTVDDFALDVDRVSFDSSFLTYITNLGLSVADLFGASCGSLTACVNDAIDDNFTRQSSIKNALKSAVAQALADTGNIQGALDFGAGTLDYAVTLTDVTTNDDKDRLRTQWDVDLSTDAAEAACAAGLARSRFIAVNAAQTASDLELVVPFRKVTDALYLITKQGDLCAPFRYATAAGSTIVQVKPRGAYQITPTGANALALSLPIAVEASISTSATSAITGTLTVAARVQPVCGGGFQVVPTSVTLGGLSGTMTYVLPTGTSITLSAAGFISTYKSTAETAILRALSPGVTLLPSAFGLSGETRWVSVGDVVTDASAMTIGLNLATRDPYCP